MDPVPWVLLAKPVLYWGVFQSARAWSDGAARSSPWRPVVAALLRGIGGVVIGIPVAVLFARLGEAGVVVGFTLFRFLLWLLFLSILFQDLGLRRRLLLAFGATGLNWGIDLVALLL